jgi:predicted component of type VI protein secretion system
MAKKGKLTEVGVQVGSVLGKADRKAHILAKEARKELHAISKQLDALKKQVAKSSKRLQKSLK